MTEFDARSAERNVLLAAALHYAKEFPVFPLAESGKEPLTEHGFKDASLDSAEIRRWWAENPNANIGCPTGADTFDVLDVDKAPGGYKSLEELRDGETLTPGPVSQTGGGGLHIFIKHVSDATTRIGFRPGLDFKSAGGYVVLPPSVHESGKCYKWIEGQELGKVDLPEAPAWLVQALRRKTRSRRKRKGRIRNGERNTQLFLTACAMRGNGLEHEEILPALQRINVIRCESQLEDEEVRKIAESAMRYPASTAIAEGLAAQRPGTSPHIGEFYVPLQAHKYLFTPTGELWPGSSVNAVIPPVVIGADEHGNEKILPATKFLDQHRHIEQMTWCPGEPMVIADRLVSDGGWTERKGCRTFNLYRPRTVVRGNAEAAGPWLDLLRRLYGEDCEHIVRWFASRVQNPGVKINHALVLGGAPGIGKDTILEPIVQAVGPWNFKEVSPPQLAAPFNNFVKSVVLRVSEAHDLGEDDRRRLFDATKTLIAAPPDTLRCNEKFVPEYSVFNMCGVVFTTNHRTHGLYLPPDDRRHFVAWSELTQGDFEQDYWTKLYRWYHAEGFANVTAYLDQLDISEFDPKEPPPKTAAFWAMVDGGRTPEDLELLDVLDALGNPKAVTINALAESADAGFAEWLRDRRNAKQVRRRLEAIGYIPVRNDGTADGRWKIQGQNRTIYAKADVPPDERRTAALRLSQGARS